MKKIVNLFITFLKLGLIGLLLNCCVFATYEQQVYGQIYQTSQYLPQYNLWQPANHVNSISQGIFNPDTLLLWQYVNTHQCCLQDIFFIDSLHGWACYNTGGVIRTTDSGFNWDSTQLVPGQAFINGIYFIDRNTGWAVGSGALIRKTTNGGVNWIIQDWPTEGALPEYFSVHFFNQYKGIAVGLKPYYYPQHSYIIITTNSGNNWDEVYISIDTNELHRQFWVNNYTGWISGDDILLKSTDGGLTYVNYYPKFPPTQNGHNGFNDLYFVNNDTGWVCGCNWDHKNIYKTTNAGMNWVFQDNPVVYYEYPQINGIIFINEDTGWASSFVGLIITTTNGGTNWIVDQRVNDETWKFSKYDKSKLWCSSVWTIYYKLLTQPNGIKPISAEIPMFYELYQNYPNPFNPVTKIKFDIPAVGQRHAFNTRLTIYDLLGRVVSNLVDKRLHPGTYEVEFDGSNYASGVYFYMIQAGNFSDTKKLVLLK